MKRYAIYFIFIPLFLMFEVISAPAKTVQGELVTVNGKRVLRVWGSNYDMGYAHGYLLADEIVMFLEDFMLGQLLDVNNYAKTSLLLKAYTKMPPAYWREIQGIYDGMTDALGRQGLYSSNLNRIFQPIDIFAWNMIPEIFRLYFNSKILDVVEPQACSSISGWGEGTPDGNLVFARNLDFGSPGDILEKNALIIAYRPSLFFKYDWVSIAWPGYIGCLSGMNQRGIGATLNLGNQQPDLDELLLTIDGVYIGIPRYYSSITFTLRQAIENWPLLFHMQDPIGNLYRSIDRIHIAGSFDLHVFMPYSSINFIADQPAAIIECSNQGIALRTAEENEDADPQLFSENYLAVTNHHRKLADPVACPRYDKLVGLLNKTTMLDMNTALDYERQVAQKTEPFNTTYIVGFMPDTLEMWVSFAEEGKTVAEAEPAHFFWEELFDQ